MNLPTTNVNGVRPANLKYEVVILTDGKPDMATLTITGISASQFREAIAEFVGAARFEPAMQDGVPVPSMFRGGLQIGSRRR